MKITIREKQTKARFLLSILSTEKQV